MNAADSVVRGRGNAWIRCLLLLGSTLTVTPAFAQSLFVQDTFTAANGTLLQNHNPDTGGAGSWVKVSGGADIDIQNNATRVTVNSNLMFYKNTTAPTGGSAEYVVGVTGTWASGNNANKVVGLVGRISGSTPDRYQVRVNDQGSTSNVVLEKVTSGGTTNLATGGVAVGNGTHTITLVIKNAVKEVRIDGTLVVSSTDNTITAAGVAGLLQNTNNFGSDIPSADDFFASTFTPTAVTLAAFSATASANGTVLLRWQTGHEANNLGFHVYRETDGQRVRVTPELVAGSSLLGRTTSRAGHRYTWRDRVPPETGQVSYWLEDVDLDGRRTWHGPVGLMAGEPAVPQSTTDMQASADGNAPVLSQLGRDASVEPTRAATAPLARRDAAVAATEDRLEVQRALAARPAIKFGIRNEGWYRVRQPEMVAAGLSPWVDPRLLQLFADGREVPIFVTGDERGRFGADAAIEFYGVGIDTPWTDTRTYWLVVGSRPGLRVTAEPRRQQARETPASFPFTVAWTPRTLYFGALLNGDAENFFGPVVSAETVTQALSLVHVDAATPQYGCVVVALQGVTAQAHEVSVALNGVALGAVAFAGQTLGEATLAVPAGVLREGDNQLTLSAVESPNDVSLVDHVWLTYPHTYEADADRLRFTLAGGEQAEVGGFTTGRIRVVDVTDPDNVRAIAGVVRATPAGYAVRVSTTGPETRTLLAFTEAGVAAPATVVANRPSAWRDADLQADLVMIAHAALIPSLQPLKALRESQGWKTAVVDVQDLYDEFSFGAKSPYAIRAFLERQNRARRQPRFVLLVGDASVDPRNYLGLGDRDLVPTKLVGTAYLETASDDWFGDFAGSGYAALAIGRLPVGTPAEAATVVAKLLAYEAGDHGREMLLVADENDGADFTAASVGLEGLLPAGWTAWQVFEGEVGADAARSELLMRLEAGPGLVNYVGHGSIALWSKHSLFTTTDALALTNGRRLPVVLAMTCLNGFFQDAYQDSLAEALLKAERGGAAAVWASSGLTDPGPQIEMNRAMVRALFDGRTLGEASLAAKARATDPDVRRTWLLFGDPAMRLR